MASIKAKLRKAFLLSTAIIAFVAVFVIDIITWSVDVEMGWLALGRHVFVLAAFGALFLLLESLWRRDIGPVRKLGFALVLMLTVVAASALLSAISVSTYEPKAESLIPSGFGAIALANVYGVVFGSTMLMTIMIVRDIVLTKRRKGSRRNFMIFAGLLLLAAISTIPLEPLESSTITSVLFALTVIMIVINSFRLTWIVYLTKREKLIGMAYGFILFCVFLGLVVLTMGETTIGRALQFYSRPLLTFVNAIEIFGTIYFGMTFVSTLFHLPTAEAFDRKTSEVSSLHNLSRLVTQVFDFNELVDSVTTMTLEVCEAKSAWLEIIHRPGTATPARSSHGSEVSEGELTVQTVALKNISREEIEIIARGKGEPLRSTIVRTGKPLVIDSVSEDRRTQHLAEVEGRIGSMVVVPLVSHEAVIGILYATKSIEYGFDREDVDLISAFADQATIAIENSRLIEKSLERERLMREMLLAQDMQRKLLPQQLPAIRQVDMDALSTPAFEVGGDYYDFARLDDDHLAILVGDVSGKGVSAAFYMAEMKGIFQSLAGVYRSPREFLIAANRALYGTLDKRSFISLIYAILDLRNGRLMLARAGHCPMLLCSNSESRYVTPPGPALGMGDLALFENTVEESTVQLATGDFVVFYTDGVTEAHPKNGDEFGYERLREVVQHCRSAAASDMRDAIIVAVDEHMKHESPDDDLTIVVLRWNGTSN